MSPDEWRRLASLLPHLRLIHHVRGRLRLRLRTGVSHWLAQYPDVVPEAWLARLPGIAALRLNKAAASLVIEYDARRIPPQWWERLLHSRDEALPDLLAEVGLIVDRAHLFSHPSEGVFA
ncbi:MAG: hypothetical protein ABTR27_02210 [Candidatus Competibacter phosphatis]|nr:hypothetical protein [Candidatus Competibacter sp.]